MYKYEPPEEEPYGCLETLLIARIAVGIVLGPTLIILAGIGLVIGSFYLVAAHPLLVLIPIAIAGAAVYAFYLWDRNRTPPGPPPC